jgi:hypothetical protein
MPTAKVRNNPALLMLANVVLVTDQASPLMLAV